LTTIASVAKRSVKVEMIEAVVKRKNATPNVCFVVRIPSSVRS